MSQVIVSGAFDNLRSKGIRFLEEASKLGALHVDLWSDAAATSYGQSAKFPQTERQYFIDAIRYVKSVAVVDQTQPAARGAIWAVPQADDSAAARQYAQSQALDYRVIPDTQLAGFPAEDGIKTSARKKVLVTGCYDWLHTGHVRFFEEVNEHGDVYAVVGHDANILLLKGEGHPQFSEAERRYMVGALRYVKQALVSTGHGWLDAEPEIQRIKPDVYAVNEDGDKPEKKNYCAANGIEYLVLKRTPKAGLTGRSSTALRGF